MKSSVRMGVLTFWIAAHSICILWDVHGRNQWQRLGCCCKVSSCRWSSDCASAIVKQPRRAKACDISRISFVVGHLFLPFLALPQGSLSHWWWELLPLALPSPPVRVPPQMSLLEVNINASIDWLFMISSRHASTNTANSRKNRNTNHWDLFQNDAKRFSKSLFLCKFCFGHRICVVLYASLPPRQLVFP